MMHEREYSASGGERATRPVIVVYEDLAAQKEAVEFCNHLVDRFWTRYEFELRWLSFNLLDEERLARQAADKAADADLFIFATRPEGSLPLPVQAWVEDWL